MDQVLKKRTDTKLAQFTEKDAVEVERVGENAI